MWIESKDPEEINAYLLSRFYKLNADLAAQTSLSPETTAFFPEMRTMLDLAYWGAVDPQYQGKRQSLVNSLMLDLGAQRERPVLYTVDEHHEIWKANLENDYFLRNFMIGTGLCAGVCVTNR
jgi:hypothetical protein